MLCLQEVQEDHYRAEIKSSLESLGMVKLLGPIHCLLPCRGNLLPFGNSVLVSSKKKKKTLIDYRIQSIAITCHHVVYPLS